MISSVFVFKVTIFIRLVHKLFKIMISLVFAFKVMVCIRIVYKLHLTQIAQIQFPKLAKIIIQIPFPNIFIKPT